MLNVYKACKVDRNIYRSQLLHACHCEEQALQHDNTAHCDLTSSYILHTTCNGYHTFLGLMQQALTSDFLRRALTPPAVCSLQATAFYRERQASMLPEYYKIKAQCMYCITCMACITAIRYTANGTCILWFPI